MFGFDEYVVSPWIIVVLAGVTLNLVVAGLASGLSSAPGWRDQRMVVVIALGACAFSLADVHTCVEPLPARLRQVSAGLGLGAASVMLGGWTVYAARVRGRMLDAVDRTILFANVVAGVAASVPGLAFTDQVFAREVTPLSLRFWDVVPSTIGAACFAIYALSSLLLLFRQVRDYQRRVPYAEYLALALGFSCIAGLHDMLASSRIINSLYLAELGFMGTVFTLGLGFTRRFAASAVELEGLTRALEARVADRTHELELTHEALAKAERLGVVGQLAAGVAHEINNPASAILANLEFMRRELDAKPRDAEFDSAMDDAAASIRRITRIVRQLLDLSRAAAQGLRSDAAAELRPVVMAGVETARASSSIPADVSIDVPELLTVHADRYLLEQVLTNLVVNAFQALHAKGRGKVAISATLEGESVIVRVKDDGVGMTEDVRSRIGEPFFSTKPVGQGTGLGLAVSLGLVKSMGGSLTFESKPGEGTTAVLALRVMSEGMRDRSSSRLSTAQDRTLLLVDDDAVVLRSLVRTLSQVYQVTSAHSVGEAQACLRDRSYDIILCDVMMPDGGAPALYAWLQQERPSEAGRTIFLTGGASSVEAREFLARGEQPVLTKPFTVAQLVEITRQLATEQ